MAAGILAACSSGKEEAAPSPTPTPTPTPTPKKPSNLSPLTALPGGRGKPVLVVKIDNTRPAHPQVGIHAADVVYFEQVEGGLSRLAAVFSGSVPSTVGPVRSARETDIELFAQYGPVAFAFSGAQSAVVRALHRSNLLLASQGFGGGWFRSGSRHAPYNLFASPERILKARPKAAKTRDIGFRFAAAVPVGMRQSNGSSVSFPAARVSWRWGAKAKRWFISVDGSPETVVGHGQIAVSNIIVQRVRIFASRLHDVTGNRTPFSVTVGKGRAQFYRDGRVISGTWSRPKKYGPTAWFANGKRYLMKPGRTWVILAPR